MKTFFSLFFLLVIVLAIYPFLDHSEDKSSITGLPWQIEILPDGSTEVFGLNIGVSKLSQALESLGDDMEIAIIAAQQETGNLEMYYGHYRAGLLSGKLVLQTDISEHKLKQWKDNAVKSEYMATGKAKKYILSPADLAAVFDETIIGLTFIPAVNLDEDVVLARFGEPDKRIEIDGAIHFLYPLKGLDIALHTESKEVIQYVPPADFQQLLAPLESGLQ